MARRSVWMSLPHEAMWWCPRERCAWIRYSTKFGYIFARWVEDTQCWVKSSQQEINRLWLARPNRGY